MFILYLSLTWERCPRKAEHQQVRLCVPSAAWKCGRAQDCPFLQEELSLHSWCSWAAFTGVCSHFDFLPLCCVSITENPRLVWGGGETLKLILPSPPLWMFQYSSSSSLFPFPVVPVSSFTNHPPFWGFRQDLCRRLMVLFVCMKKLRFKCCGVIVQKCKYFPNYILCAL